MMVKICGITVREDALAAVEAGADALGFNFYPASPRYMTPDRAAELAADIDAIKVGIFVNESPATVTEIMNVAGLDVAQVYGDLGYPKARTWRACRVKSADFKLPDDDDAEAFLLDGYSADGYGGMGKPFAWEIARGLPHKIILAGGLDDSNVCDAIERAQPWGVDACSRIEKSPGRKDHQRMTRFIKAAHSSAI